MHRENGSRLNGVHIELTGEHVTECTGGPEGLLETDLPRHYTTLCDPRLNYAQSLEVDLNLSVSPPSSKPTPISNPRFPPRLDMQLSHSTQQNVLTLS